MLYLKAMINRRLYRPRIQLKRGVAMDDLLSSEVDLEVKADLTEIAPCLIGHTRNTKAELVNCLPHHFGFVHLLPTLVFLKNIF